MFSEVFFFCAHENDQPSVLTAGVFYALFTPTVRPTVRTGRVRLTLVACLFSLLSPFSFLPSLPSRGHFVLIWVDLFSFKHVQKILLGIFSSSLVTCTARWRSAPAQSHGFPLSTEIASMFYIRSMPKMGTW